MDYQICDKIKSTNGPPLPLVSIVVASRNSVETIERCLKSVITQTHSDIELIVIDGGSNDGTVAILDRYSKSISYWESMPDRGIAHAWNKALDHIKGEWILFLGSDDFLVEPRVIEQFKKRIEKHTAAGGKVVYGQINMILPNGKHLCTHGADWCKIRATFFTEKMLLPHPACFYHFSIFNDYQRFDENLHIAMDYDFLLRVCKIEQPLYLKKFIVTNMTVGGLSSNILTIITKEKEVKKVLSKNNIRYSRIKYIVNISVYYIALYIEKYISIKYAKYFLDILRIMQGKKKIWSLY